MDLTDNDRQRIEQDYEPFGPQWQKELMKFKKIELIGLYKVSQQDIQKLEAERSELLEQKKTLAERVLLLDRTLKENHDHAQKSWEEDQQKISELRNKVIEEIITEVQKITFQDYSRRHVVQLLNSLKNK